MGFLGSWMGGGDWRAVKLEGQWVIDGIRLWKRSGFASKVAVMPRLIEFAGGSGLEVRWREGLSASSTRSSIRLLSSLKTEPHRSDIHRNAMVSLMLDHGDCPLDCAPNWRSSITLSTHRRGTVASPPGLHQRKWSPRDPSYGEDRSRSCTRRRRAN